MKNNIKRKTKLKPWAFWLLLGLSLFLITFNICKYLNWKKDNEAIKNLEVKIQILAPGIFTDNEGVLINPPEDEIKTQEYDYWYYANKPFYEVDFTELLKENSDTIAFIHINNTNVNYPVVQTNNNEYYLNHAFDKSKNSAGWVFMDYRNNFNEMDDNTIIYGHGRRNKTVFGSLRETLSNTWQQNPDNHIINLSTPDKNYVYQIFSIYTIKSETYYITTNFFSSSDKEVWITEMKNRNIATDIKTEVNKNDKILTLSTCYNDNGLRTVIHAKLIKTSN